MCYILLFTYISTIHLYIILYILFQTILFQNRVLILIYKYSSENIYLSQCSKNIIRHKIIELGTHFSQDL